MGESEKGMKELLNKTILKIELNKENDYIVFTTHDSNEDFKKISYQTTGDCCSTSWFSHISGVKNLLGQKVIEVKDREEFTDAEQKKAESEGDYESLALYGIILKAEKGSCDIEFRNDSNGYYGGSCDLTTFNRLQEVREINEDF